MENNPSYAFAKIFFPRLMNFLFFLSLLKSLDAEEAAIAVASVALVTTTTTTMSMFVKKAFIVIFITI